MDTVDALVIQVEGTAKNTKKIEEEKKLLEEQQDTMDKVDGLEAQYSALSIKVDKVDSITTTLSAISLETAKLSGF